MQAKVTGQNMLLLATRSFSDKLQKFVKEFKKWFMETDAAAISRHVEPFWICYNVRFDFGEQVVLLERLSE